MAKTAVFTKGSAKRIAAVVRQVEGASFAQDDLQGGRRRRKRLKVSGGGGGAPAGKPCVVREVDYDEDEEVWVQLVLKQEDGTLWFGTGPGGEAPNPWFKTPCWIGMRGWNFRGLITTATQVTPDLPVQELVKHLGEWRVRQVMKEEPLVIENTSKILFSDCNAGVAAY